MHAANQFVEALAIVLCAAAVTTVLFHRLHQPVVLGYIIAGLLIGPHVSVPLVADPGIVRALSELGVILLMFSLGLEFRLRKLLHVGLPGALTAVVQCSIMIWLGFVIGQAFGWTAKESLFTGAIIAISSTTIIAKAFDELDVRGRRRDLVLAVLIVEDLVAILLLAVLTAIATGQGLSARELSLTVGGLAAFLLGLVLFGLLLVPRVVRLIARQEQDEMTLVAVVGICFAIALLAQAFGYSVALGAFLAGSLVAESDEVPRIERLVHPVRDVFAAIFFVSVGMMIAPALVVEHWVPIVVLTGIVIAGKIASVALGAFLAGQGVVLSVQTGMSLAQIGEFSFIIAGLGISLGATGDFLYPVAVTVSALTTLVTPWLIRASTPVATHIDRRLPRSLQTFASLYGSWLEQIRRGLGRGASASVERRLVRRLLRDAGLLLAITIGVALGWERLARAISLRLNVNEDAARAFVLAAALALALPLCLGIVRLARRLGARLAALALPEQAPGAVDLAAAPRRALVVALQLAIVLMVGTPIVAVTQPFLPGYAVALAVLAMVLALSVGFWRRAEDLQGHVMAGAEMILQILGRGARESAHEGQIMDQARELLPGLGALMSLRVPDRGAALGKTLAELELRSRTGAIVLALARGTRAIVPTGHEILQAGDVLAVTGTDEAVAAAREMIEGSDEAEGVR